MSNASPVLLILGAGSNIGQHVARAFAAKGYKVALAARRLKEEDSTADQVNIPSDLSDPNSVTSVFSKVNAQLGPPSVVIYNGDYDTWNEDSTEFELIFSKLVQQPRMMLRIHSLSH